MKKINLKLAAVVAVVIAILIIIGVVVKNMPENYSAAYEKTNALESYNVSISTIVSIKDGEGEKQSCIDQTLRVENKGKKNMRYEVTTDATSTDMVTGQITSQTNTYLYNNEKYYYTYPGVRYKSPTGLDAATDNIKNLTNVIAFSPEQMKNVKTSNTKDGTVYEYGVDFAATSAYIKSTIENAIYLFEDGNFKLDTVGAAAVVSDGYVTEREFYVTYVAEGGKSVTVEVYTSLVNTHETVAPPDEREFADITV